MRNRGFIFTSTYAIIKLCTFGATFSWAKLIVFFSFFLYTFSKEVTIYNMTCREALKYDRCSHIAAVGMYLVIPVLEGLLKPAVKIKVKQSQIKNFQKCLLPMNTFVQKSVIFMILYYLYFINSFVLSFQKVCLIFIPLVCIQYFTMSEFTLFILFKATWTIGLTFFIKMALDTNIEYS